MLTALPQTAYTDFFLPLLSRCPSAMGIKNKDGETPGQILGWGPPWDSAEEEEEDEASKEREWSQKLQGELEDEWQEVIGRFEGKNPFPSTAALLPHWLLFLHPLHECSHWLPMVPSSVLPHLSCLSPSHGLPATTTSHPPKQMMLPMRPRNPSPSQPGQIAWPGNMPRSASSSARQREPADPHGLRARVRAGGSSRRSSGSSKSEPGPRRKNCVRAEPGGHRRLPGIECWSQPGPGPGQSTPEERGGADSGASVMCPGPALAEETQKPWLQPWWPGALPWRSRGP